MKIDLGTMRLGANLRGPMVISLEAGEFLRLEEGKGVRVRCEAGSLWITREASSEDLWLRQGESAVVDARGLTLIEAVDLTRLSLAPPAPL